MGRSGKLVGMSVARVLLAAAFCVSILWVSLADPLDQWTSRTRSTDSGFSLYDVTCGNGIFVAGGAATNFQSVPLKRAILYSLSGVNWEEAPPTRAQLRIALELPVHGVSYGSGRFISVGSLDGSWGQFSTNGADWFGITSNSAGFAVAFGHGTFVSVGADYHRLSDNFQFSSALIALSDDGSHWQILPSKTTNYLYGVTFGQDRFVAVGQYGAIIVSTNAVDWQQVSSGTDTWLNRVVYGNGRYVAIGQRGTVLLSTNSIDWSQVDAGTTNELRGVAYGDGSS